MVILMSSVVGIVLGGSIMLAKRSRDPIPFGPYLAIAGWVCLLWRDSVVGLLG
jgi:leader peptidase (prepilin peptidase)/N-methyltransferase